MADWFYKINGTNILPYIAEDGFTWGDNDLDSEDSGRTLDGVMHRTRIAIKDKHELSCRPLTTDEARIVLNAVSGEFVTVSTNIHPKKSGTVTMTMYNSSRSAAVLRLDDDGYAMWNDIKFNLIER